MKLLGGMELVVDGRTVNPGTTLSYKGMMFSDVPNLASTFGYTNASWTLKADLTAEYLCRILNTMDRGGYAYCTPRNNDPSVTPGCDAAALVGLHAAGQGYPAEAGLEAAVEALPELRQGHAGLALRIDRRRHLGVHAPCRPIGAAPQA